MALRVTQRCFPNFFGAVDFSGPQSTGLFMEPGQYVCRLGRVHEPQAAFAPSLAAPLSGDEARAVGGNAEGLAARGEPVTVAAINHRLRRRQDGQGYFPLPELGELVGHHPVEQAPPAVGR